MSKREDITDKIYGRLLALVTDWYKTKETGKTHWFCQCIDNNIVSVNIASLKSGKSKSCGCLHKEKSSENMSKIGKNNKKENNPNWNGGKVTIICKQCGKEKKVWSYREETAQFCNKKCRGKWESENYIGKNNPNWKGGISSISNIIRTSKKYEKFVQKVLKGDNYICQISGKKSSKDLQVHHIKGFAKILEENNITTIEEAENCEELWDTKNCITLSEEWHLGQKTDNPLAFHRLYGTVNFTEEDFYEWFGFILKMKLVKYIMLNFYREYNEFNIFEQRLGVS